MSKEVISTDAAPAAIGPYSQAVRAGNMLFISGQIPLDPASGKLVDGGVEVQTARVMESLGAVLSAAGADFSKVVRTTIFLSDLENFTKVNAVYERSFAGSQPPARACVEVSRLPRDVAVEIDAIAYLGD